LSLFMCKHPWSNNSDCNLMTVFNNQEEIIHCLIISLSKYLPKHPRLHIQGAIRQNKICYVYLPFPWGLTIWAHQSHEPRALSSAPRYPFSWHLICHSPVGCWDSRGPRPIPAGPTWLNTAVGVVTENIAPVTTPPIITHLAAKYKTCATIAITANVISIQKKQYFYILHNLNQYWHHSKESINNFRALFSRYNPDSWRQTRRAPSPHGPMRSLPLPALGSTVCFPPKQWVSKPSVHCLPPSPPSLSHFRCLLSFSVITALAHLFQRGSRAGFPDRLR